MVFTDHKPLIPIFSKPQSKPPSRIQVQSYDMIINYHSGSDGPVDYRHDPQIRMLPIVIIWIEWKEVINLVAQHSAPKAVTPDDIKRATQNLVLLKKDHNAKATLKEHAVWTYHRVKSELVITSY